MILEIVFVGQCEVFVGLDLVHFYFFFPWPQSSQVHYRGVNSLKNVEYPLNKVSNSL